MIKAQPDIDSVGLFFVFVQGAEGVSADAVMPQAAASANGKGKASPIAENAQKAAENFRKGYDKDLSESQEHDENIYTELLNKGLDEKIALRVASMPSINSKHMQDHPIIGALFGSENPYAKALGFDRAHRLLSVMEKNRAGFLIEPFSFLAYSPGAVDAITNAVLDNKTGFKIIDDKTDMNYNAAYYNPNEDANLITIGVGLNPPGAFKSEVIRNNTVLAGIISHEAGHVEYTFSNPAYVGVETDDWKAYIAPHITNEGTAIFHEMRFLSDVNKAFGNDLVKSWFPVSAPLPVGEIQKKFWQGDRLKIYEDNVGNMNKSALIEKLGDTYRYAKPSTHAAALAGDYYGYDGATVLAGMRGISVDQLKQQYKENPMNYQEYYRMTHQAYHLSNGKLIK